jgi:hypothetical protein
MRLSLRSLRPTLMGHPLDLDSTVCCRDGEHEGSLIGHNPIQHGRPSHHPLVAWLRERQRLLWATVRAGHAEMVNGVREFLAHALTMLPAGHRIGLVCADTAFCVTAFVTALESRELPYSIVARLTPLVRKRIIHRIPEVAWQPVTRGIAVADVMATRPARRGPARQFGCLRQTLTARPATSGRRVIECPGSTYRVFSTTVPFAAELGTRMDTGRADCENRIKELTEDLSLNTFCLQSFDATDAAFRIGCVLYNLLMGFRETVLPSCWFERRLRAVRDLVFLVGAALIPDARRLYVRFAVPPEERPEFLQRLRTLSEGLPIAAQLAWDLNEASETNQPSVHAVNVPVPTVRPSPHTPRASPYAHHYCGIRDYVPHNFFPCSTDSVTPFAPTSLSFPLSTDVDDFFARSSRCSEMSAAAISSWIPIRRRKRAPLNCPVCSASEN